MWADLYVNRILAYPESVSLARVKMAFIILYISPTINLLLVRLVTLFSLAKVSLSILVNPVPAILFLFNPSAYSTNQFSVKMFQQKYHSISIGPNSTSSRTLQCSIGTVSDECGQADLLATDGPQAS
jgi:hypothetical protein